MRRTRLFVALATLLLSTSALTACGDDGHDYHGIQRDSPLEVVDYSLPEVTGGGTGGAFPFKAAPGTLLAVYFGYTTCPDLCPTTMTDLKQAKEDLGADGSKVRVAMASVDPTVTRRPCSATT